MAMPPPITVRSALAELLDIDHAVLHEVSDGPPACGVEELFGIAAFDVLAQRHDSQGRRVRS